MRTSVIAAVGVVAVLGCSSTSPATPPTDAVPTPAELHAFGTLNSIIATPLTIAGVTRWAYVDTGNPETLLDGLQFMADTVFPDGVVASTTIGGITELNMVVDDTPSGDVAGDPELPLFGNLGCTTLCGHVATFDYAANLFALDSSAPPASAVGAEFVLPFTLVGNAGDGSATLPPSRALVQVALEGTTYTMMIDTGATYVALGSAAFTALTSDGRVTAPDISELANGAPAPGLLARAATVTAGSASVSGAIVSHSDGFDSVLAAISADAGQTVDGSLGGTFLRNFAVTVDYPNQMLHLAPYADTSAAIELGSSIGIRFGGATDDGFPVAAVSGAAQAAGVVVGDIVGKIDDLALDEVGFFQATAALYGTAGATKQLEVNGHIVAIAVDAQLPK